MKMTLPTRHTKKPVNFISNLNIKHELNVIKMFTLQYFLFAANDIRDDYTFFHTFDASVRDHFKVNVNSVVVFQAERFFTKYESKRQVLEVKVCKATFVQNYSLFIVYCSKRI